MRNSPPFHTVLHNNILTLHPHRLPNARQVLHGLLRSLLNPKIQEISHKPGRRTQHAGQKGIEDHSLLDRRNRHKLGKHLPSPIPPASHIHTFIAVVLGRILGWHVGLRGSKGG